MRARRDCWGMCAVTSCVPLPLPSLSALALALALLCCLFLEERPFSPIRKRNVIAVLDMRAALRPTVGVVRVSVSFPEGAIGLLGPNGAGKSTMIKALLGLIKPDNGRIRVLDFDVAVAPLEIRARVGYMPENDAQIPGMSAVSFVAYCGELSGLPPADAMQRAHEVLYYVGLGEARYRNVETYSTGMKQRIKWRSDGTRPGLALDEQTTG